MITDRKIKEAKSITELLMTRRKKKNQELSQSRSWMSCIPGHLACPYPLLQVDTDIVRLCA